MSPNPLTYARFIPFFLRLKLLNLTSRFPPLEGDILDEQLRLLRKGQEALGETPLDQGTPQQARADFHNTIGILKSVGGLFEEVDAVRDLSIPGPVGALPARLYLPGKGQSYPLFVLFHGGG